MRYSPPMSPTPQELKKVKEFWKKCAQENLRVAENMFQSKRYNFTMFMCHQTLEACLKALFIDSKEDRPPHIHKLPRLLEHIGLEVPPEIDQTILEADAHYIKARYFKDRFNPKIYNKKNAAHLLDKTRRTLKWLFAKIN